MDDLIASLFPPEEPQQQEEQQHDSSAAAEDASSAASAASSGAAPRWNLRAALWEAASNIGRMTEATRELLRDKELRKKGASFLVARVQEGVQELQKGIQKNASALGKQLSQRMDINRQQLTSLMSRLEKQISDYQRERQLSNHKRQPVDVQIGAEVFEGVPQEARCRLWMAILQDPTLVEPFRPIQCRSHALLALPPKVLEQASPSAAAAAPAAVATAAAAEPVAGHIQLVDLLGSPGDERPLAAAADVGAEVHGAGQSGVGGSNEAVSEQAGVSAGTSAGRGGSDITASPGGGCAVGSSGAGDLIDMSSPRQELEMMRLAGELQQDQDVLPQELPPLGDVLMHLGDGGMGSATSANVNGELTGGAACPGADTVPGLRVAADCSGRQQGAGDAGTAQASGSSSAASQQQQEQVAAPVPSSAHEQGEDWAVRRQGQEGREEPASPSERRISQGAVGPGSQGQGQEGQRDEGQHTPLRLRQSSDVPSDAEDWEVVNEVAALAAVSSLRGWGTASEGVQQMLKHLVAGRSGDGDTAPDQTARLCLAQAMLDAPWIPGDGVPQDYSEDSRFAILNDMTAGQEEVDDVIRRDIHRTFPEHPLFSATPQDHYQNPAQTQPTTTSQPAPSTAYVPPQAPLDAAAAVPAPGTPPTTSSSVPGPSATAPTPSSASAAPSALSSKGADGQESLFRVLKAYSLHDLEVGYCQGMAFVAGILLMYLPQEPAFRLFCRLMDPEGPNLRRMYLPGLDALKEKLAAFEWLMLQLHPHLYGHIQQYGVPSVLYASQWFMTLFSTPFPSHFSARVIDIMLQDGNDNILMRIALVIMRHLESDLLQQEDFEHIVTQLKVPPARWGPAKLRQVLADALDSPVTDAQLQHATSTAQQQLAHAHSGRSLSRGSSRGRSGGLALVAGDHAAAAAHESREGADRGQAGTQGRGAEGAAAATGTMPGVSGRDLIDLDSELLAEAGLGDLDHLASPVGTSGAGSGGGAAGVPGAVQGLKGLMDIDDEYIRLIVELDLLSPWERQAMDGSGTGPDGTGGSSSGQGKQD